MANAKNGIYPISMERERFFLGRGARFCVPPILIRAQGVARGRHGQDLVAVEHAGGQACGSEQRRVAQSMGSHAHLTVIL